MLVHNLPVSREAWVGGRALEDDRGHTQKQRCVDDVCVTCDPAHITTAEEDILIVDVEDIFARCCCAKQVSSRGVHDTLGLAGRAGCVEKEERIFGAHRFRGNVRGPLVDLLVPPEIPTLGHWDFGAGALVDQAVLYVWALLQRLIDDLLRANDLAATLALVRRDDHGRARVNDTIAQRVGREPSENDRVHRADTRASQESDQSLGNHGHVQRHGIALLHAHLLQHIGDLGDLAQQLAIRDGAALVRLVGLVDDGGLVRVLDGVAVDAVVRSVEAALEEPGVVAVGEGARVDGLEVALPGQEVARHFAPELIGFLDRLLVHLLIGVEVAEMRFRRVLVQESLRDAVREHVGLVSLSLARACRLGGLLHLEIGKSQGERRPH